MLMLILLGLITTAVLISQVVSFRRLYHYVESELRFAPGNYAPKVAVILPCKGLDQGFRENVQQLLAQDYACGKPNFEIVFTVACKDDPAYPVLAELAASPASVRIKLVVAGTNPNRAQKINNQLHALKEVSDD